MKDMITVKLNNNNSITIRKPSFDDAWKLKCSFTSHLTANELINVHKELKLIKTMIIESDVDNKKTEKESHSIQAYNLSLKIMNDMQFMNDIKTVLFKYTHEYNDANGRMLLGDDKRAEIMERIMERDEFRAGFGNICLEIVLHTVMVFLESHLSILPLVEKMSTKI